MSGSCDLDTQTQRLRALLSRCDQIERALLVNLLEVLSALNETREARQTIQGYAKHTRTPESPDWSATRA
jgi:hypothetical protein